MHSACANLARPFANLLLKRGPLIIVLVLSDLNYCHSKAAYQVTLSNDQIGNSLKNQWDSIESLSLTSHEFRLDDSGTRNSNLPFYEYNLKFNSEEQRSLNAIFHAKDGTTRYLEDLREDGTYRHRVIHKENSNQILEVNSETQTNGKDHYDGMMFAAMWLICPDGSPLIKHFKEGAIAIQKGDAVELTFNSENRLITCILDPSFDWLPRSLKIGAGDRALNYKVLEFGEADGRRYPKRGTFESVSSDGSVRMKGFEIVKFEVNTPINPEHFSKPKILPGMVYNDKLGRRILKGGSKELSKLPKNEIRQIDNAPQNNTPTMVSIMVMVSFIIAIASGVFIFIKMKFYS